MIFMGMWVIVNWWVWPVPDFHFRKLEAMEWVKAIGNTEDEWVKIAGATEGENF